VTYDVTNPYSFSNIQKWFAEIDRYACTNVRCLVVGNKVDRVDDRRVSTEEGKDLANKLGIEFLETSAKDSQNVGHAFERMAKTIMEELEA
jgi:Ras-related protein Rab-1A